jgi:hypothetical protein
MHAWAHCMQHLELRRLNGAALHSVHTRWYLVSLGGRAVVGSLRRQGVCWPRHEVACLPLCLVSSRLVSSRVVLDRLGPSCYACAISSPSLLRRKRELFKHARLTPLPTPTTQLTYPLPAYLPTPSLVDRRTSIPTTAQVQPANQPHPPTSRTAQRARPPPAEQAAVSAPAHSHRARPCFSAGRGCSRYLASAEGQRGRGQRACWQAISAARDATATATGSAHRGARTARGCCLFWVVWRRLRIDWLSILGCCVASCRVVG